MADSTLNQIRLTVRRITRSPSPSQLTEDQLLQYINTFVLYDFPENIRLFALRQTLTFYTQPNIDTYQTTTGTATAPLFNFRNKYIAVHPPVFIAGVPAFYTQQRDVFYGYWPQTNFVAQLPFAGTGGTGPFTGTVTGHPLLQNSVNFNTTNAVGGSMVLIDRPFTAQLGQLIVPNDPAIIYGTINYITGAFTFTFPNNTLVLAPIYVEGIAYQPGIPTSMLYFDDKFVIRPVPDKVYAIQIEVDARPTELLDNNASPYLEQWWQYIALGASMKVFRDRMDTDSMQQLYPEFNRQERLCLRTTLTQQANERTTTLYTQGRTWSPWTGFFGTGWPY